LPKVGSSSTVAEPQRRKWLRRAPRLAFGGVLVYAFFFWMNAGRKEWFYLDEWDFLAGRKVTSVNDLFRPHNEHWTTIPILVYRTLYKMFGLRSYYPYRVTIVVLYLIAAALLFVVIRRAGVNDWIAAAAGSAFALYGVGWENAIRPFQMAFTGALVFGLVFLLLTDHDGGLNRRDYVGLGAGLMALMMSGVGVVMVAIVGLSVLLRRGWRLAILLVAPLAAIYTLWFAVTGRTGKVRFASKDALTVGAAFAFLRQGFQTTFRSIPHNPVLGVLLAIALAVGIPLAWRARRESAQLGQLAAPMSLLAGSVLFLVSAAAGRAAFGQQYAGASRYLSLTTAMILPALAIAFDGLARRWRWVLPVAVVLLVGAIPWNLRGVSAAQVPLKRSYENTRLTILSLPRSDIAQKVPGELRPEQYTAHEVTIGWLLSGVAAGRIPPPPFTIRKVRESSQFRLSFFQHHGDAPTTECVTVTDPVAMRVRLGQVIGVYDNPMVIVPLSPPSMVGFGLAFVPTEGNAVTVVYPVARKIEIKPYIGQHPPRVCFGPNVILPGVVHRSTP
jgi:hypothetical protein